MYPRYNIDDKKSGNHQIGIKEKKKRTWLAGLNKE